jgi:hypothetical protein
VGSLPITNRHDPVTTDPLSIESGEMAICFRGSESVVAIRRRPLAQEIEQGGEIVCTAGNGGDCAMSARRILGGQYLPRVGLFAH